jgi:peptidoglycan/LPS O-acetylase OafA/YrhL
VQAIEAVGVLAASLIAGVDALSGKSYHRDSGIAITLIGVVTAVLLGYVARGVQSGRRWSRTPAVLTQLFTGIVAIYLIQAPRLDWGIPAIALAIAGFAALLAPSSLRVLTPGRREKT